MLRNPYSPNQKRPTAVGAFISPSETDISLLLLPHIRGCDILRQAAIKPDLDHCDLIPRARRTNRLFDCDIRADRSSIDVRVRKPAMVPAAATNRRHGGAKLSRDGGTVRALIERKNSRRLTFCVTITPPHQSKAAPPVRRSRLPATPRNIAHRASPPTASS